MLCNDKRSMYYNILIIETWENNLIKNHMLETEILKLGMQFDDN